jgi:hypothetical protein
MKSLRVQETFNELWRTLDLVASLLAMIGLGLAIYSVSIEAGKSPGFWIIDVYDYHIA